MTSVLDLWRWLDPAARLVSGSTDRLARPVRGVARTRAAPPHLPSAGGGQLLVVDASIVPVTDLDELVAALDDSGHDPAAVWLAGGTRPFGEPAAAGPPILSGEAVAADIERRAMRHLEAERDELAAFAATLRLAGAEAALADPRPAAPAGAVADRLHRGVAVSVGGDLSALMPRPSGRALATRFAAVHGRLPARRNAGAGIRRSADGLWLLERAVDAAGTNAVAWLFDDIPLARVDEVALDALATTLRALLRRQPPDPDRPRPVRRLPPSTGDPMHDTLLAVARANGRVAPAARALGVHRNTVLYRLRRASTELGIDPRRPEDALRLLRGTGEA